MEELLKEIKEHYIEQPNVKRGKFYIEALTLEKIIKDWLTNNKRLQLEVMPKIAEIIKLINERIEYYDYDIDCEYVVSIEKDEAFKTGALEALEDLKERLSNFTA